MKRRINEVEPQEIMSLFELFDGEKMALPAHMIPLKKKRIRKIKTGVENDESFSILNEFEKDEGGK